MIAHVAGALALAALVACSSSKEGTAPAGDHTAPPPAAPIASGGSAMDLVHADHVSLDLALPAAGSRTQRVNVPPGHNIMFTMTHTGGPIGRMSLTIHDDGNSAIPVSDDAMTCAEPGCTFSVEVASAAAARTLLATCGTSGAMSVRFEAKLK